MVAVTSRQLRLARPLSAHSQATHRRWQIREGGDPPEVAHRLALRVPIFGEDERRFPKAKRAVMLERRHSTEHSSVSEVRHTPFQRLLHARAACVHDLSQMLQNRPRAWRRLGDVSINARIFGGHVGVQ